MRNIFVHFLSSTDGTANTITSTLDDGDQVNPRSYATGRSGESGGEDSVKLILVFHSPIAVPVSLLPPLTLKTRTSRFRGSAFAIRRLMVQLCDNRYGIEE